MWLVLAGRRFWESAALPDARQEAGRGESESKRKFHDIEQAEISFPPLDSANVGPMQIGPFCKTRLSPCGLSADQLEAHKKTARSARAPDATGRRKIGSCFLRYSEQD